MDAIKIKAFTRLGESTFQGVELPAVLETLEAWHPDAWPWKVEVTHADGRTEKLYSRI